MQPFRNFQLLEKTNCCRKLVLKYPQQLAYILIKTTSQLSNYHLFIYNTSKCQVGITTNNHAKLANLQLVFKKKTCLIYEEIDMLTKVMLDDMFFGYEIVS